jgi:cyclic pyranopterin phosphate synthase
LSCVYCVPAKGDLPVVERSIVRFDEILRLVKMLQRVFGLSKIHLTGGEPLLRPRLVEFVMMLSEHYTGELAITTNGQLLSSMAGPLKTAGLTRVNVSLDSLDPVMFAKMSRGGQLQRTLDGIDAALAKGLTPVKLNVTVNKGYNDTELLQLADYGLQRGCEVRFLELMPIGCARKEFYGLYFPTSQVRRLLEVHYKFEALPYALPASSRDFKVRDDQGTEGLIGFISPVSNPFCCGCRRFRLTSRGQLVLCLSSGKTVETRHLLAEENRENEVALEEFITGGADSKLRVPVYNTKQTMLSVGG